jgi:hypothetical protein
MAMTSGARIDAVRDIVLTTTTADRRVAGRLAILLNRLLERIAADSERRQLSTTERVVLFGDSKGRCGLCGREFSKLQKEAFLDGSARSAPLENNAYDRWKPIYALVGGWTIDDDHRMPLAGSGLDDIENLQLTCHYCNLTKRHWTSIFDRPPRVRLDEDDGLWKFHALRLIAIGGCATCGAKRHMKELTVAPYSLDALDSIANFYVTCHEHDVVSKSRWLTC